MKKIIKCLHTADWHFRDIDHDEIVKCLEFMIGVARGKQPDITVVSGDITDRYDLKLDSRSAKSIVRLMSALADIAPVAIIIGTPSHDGNSAEILSYVKGKHQVWVSKMPEQIYMKDGRLSHDTADFSGTDDELDAIITQIPTPTKQFFNSDAGIAETDQQVSEAMGRMFGALGAVAGSNPDVPHILSGHFQVRGSKISETQQLIGRDVEVPTDYLAMTNSHVNCLGHIHMAQELGSNTFYSGSAYRKDHGETEDKGFYIHTIERGKGLVSSDFIQVPTRTLISLEHDLSKEGIPEDGTIVDSLIPKDFAYGGAHVKLVVSVYQDEAEHINKADLERTLMDRGAESANVKLVRIPRVNVRAKEILKAKILRDKMYALARLRLEEVPESILDKADLLETVSADDLMKMVGGVN